MKKKTPILFLEINNSEYLFVVGKENESEEFEIIYKISLPLKGIENSTLINFDLALELIKKNIFIIEEKLEFTFKEIILILNVFNFSFINLTGFKKLNGSQLLKENISYILNTLKSNIDKNERKKKIIHIFNSKYFLDRKEIKNIPIGLFGNFYSHELSFCLINNNDLNNLNNIFNKCNLKIKKIYAKNFIKGSYLDNKNEKYNTFFSIRINKNDTEIYYFDNGCLKYQENFNFGTELVFNDISKVTLLKNTTLEKIITFHQFNQDYKEEDLLEKDFFKDESYKKIKKKLLFEIAKARIDEILEKFLIKNLNLLGYDNRDKLVLIEITDKKHLKCFEKIYKSLLKTNNYKVEFKDNIKTEELFTHLNQILNYGWKKEAIPVTNTKKSIIAKIFEILFN